MVPSFLYSLINAVQNILRISWARINGHCHYNATSSILLMYCIVKMDTGVMILSECHHINMIDNDTVIMPWLKLLFQTFSFSVKLAVFHFDFRYNNKVGHLLSELRCWICTVQFYLAKLLVRCRKFRDCIPSSDSRWPTFLAFHF